MLNLSPDNLICAFCRKRHDEVGKIFIDIRVDFEGNVFENSICTECIRGFVFTIAYENPEQFNKLIEEARAFKPETGEPENPI